jgi:Family of unknown function (DUF6152)
MSRSFVLALFSSGDDAHGRGGIQSEPARRFLPGAPARHRPPPAGRNGARSGLRSLRHGLLRATFAVLTFAIGCVAAGSVAMAHHSVTMFDREHPIQLIGAVREFKFVNPHASIILEVVGEDALPVIWNLEGDSANSLKWDGWSGQTLKPGDELRITVEPLRNGAHGAFWHARNTTYKDGRPIVAIGER